MNIIDIFCMAPFRWIDDPVSAFWLGSAMLALASFLVGQATSWLAMRFNGAGLQKHVEDARRYENAYLGMLRHGEANPSGVNSLANESFGKAFFMGIATSAAGLWPVFLAAGWIDLHFAGVRVPLAGVEGGISNVAPLVLAYIALFFTFSRFSKAVRARLNRTACANG